MKLRRHILKLIALALSWLLVGYTAYVYAQTTLSTIYIMAGPYPGSYDYTIWKESTTYYAKDSVGQIDYSGTNASQIILNTASEGKSILLLDGIYDLTVDLRITSSNIEIEGMGYDTVLKSTAYVNNTISFFGTVSNFSISNMRIDGNYMAKTLLGVYASGGISENGNVNRLWLHSNRREFAASPLWFWDWDESFHMKNMNIANIIMWDIDTGALNQDNVAFAYVDGLTVKDSVFNIERVVIPYHTKNALFDHIKIQAQEYSPFVDDPSNNGTKVINSVMNGALLYGNNTVFDSNELTSGIKIGEIAWSWKGTNIKVTNNRIIGPNPLLIYANYTIIEYNDIKTTSGYAITLLNESAITSDYVNIKGNTINAGASWGIVGYVNSGTVVYITQNYILGNGGGISLSGSGAAFVGENWIPLASPELQTTNWTGLLYLSTWNASSFGYKP